MRSLSFSNFEFILKRLNKDIRIFPAKSSRSSMVYLYKPNHPDANDYGLLEICGFPSPNYFFSFPKYNFLDHTGQPQRGWNTVFKILASKHLINRDLLRRVLPTAFSAVHGSVSGKKEVDERAKTVPFYSSPVKKTKIKLKRSLKGPLHIEVERNEEKRGTTLYFT